MKKIEINKELQQIKEITNIIISNVGFVNLSEFESEDDDYIYIIGDDIYNI